MGTPMGRFYGLRQQGQIDESKKACFFAEELAEEYGGKEAGRVVVFYAPDGVDAFTLSGNGRERIEKWARKYGLSVRFEERPRGFVRAHVADAEV